MRFTIVALLSALLLATGAHALTLTEFLNDPRYALFVQKALAVPACLSDPAVSGNPPAFDLDKCPSLQGMLDALNAGATTYDIQCEPECAASVLTLGPDCFNGLVNAFQGDSNPIGVLGYKFIEECQAVEAGGGGSFAPSPAPAGFDMGSMAAPEPAPSARKLKM